MADGTDAFKPELFSNKASVSVFGFDGSLGSKESAILQEFEKEVARLLGWELK
jgi:hypothetical protein